EDSGHEGQVKAGTDVGIETLQVGRDFVLFVNPGKRHGERAAALLNWKLTLAFKLPNRVAIAGLPTGWRSFAGDKQNFGACAPSLRPAGRSMSIPFGVNLKLIA